MCGSPRFGEIKEVGVQVGALEHKIDVLSDALTQMHTNLLAEVRTLRVANEALYKTIQYKEDLRVALERFGRFDINEATCFLEADRQRLLAVVETAYGSLAHFNAAVHSLFKQENAHRFEWMSKSTHKAGKKQVTTARASARPSLNA